MLELLEPKSSSGKGQKPDFLSGGGDDDFPVSTETARKKAPVKSKKREMKVGHELCVWGMVSRPIFAMKGIVIRTICHYF